MAIFVRCIDNTLAGDVLVVGEIYEVMHINERDGYYALSGLGPFTMTRFELVSAADAGYWPSRVRPPGKSPTRHSRRLCVNCHRMLGHIDLEQIPVDFTHSLHG